MVSVSRGHSGHEPSKFAGGFETGHHGHGLVEKNQIGVEPFCLIDTVAAIFRLTANFPIGLLLDKTAQTVPYGGTVVDDENAWHITLISLNAVSILLSMQASRNRVNTVR